LTQVIQSLQMATPLRINGLQEHRTLEVAPVRLAYHINLGLQQTLGLIDNAIVQIIVSQIGFFLQHFSQRQLNLEGALQSSSQARDIPLLFHRVLRHVFTEQTADSRFTQAADGVGNISGLQHFVTLGVDHLALIVGHVVILQQLFTNIEVAGLDLALGRLDGTSHHTGFDRLALWQTQTLHNGAHPVTGEDAHQRIFQRQVEARGTWVTLTTGTTTQLVVDTAGLVPLGTNNAQTTRLFDLLVQRLPRGADSLDLGFFLFGAQGLVFTNLGNRTLDAATQHNIGTTTGHIGSDGDMTRHTSFSHDIGFTGVL